MFESNSRYYSLPDAKLVTRDGQVVIFKKRRFLPNPENMQLLVEVEVAQGDRLDLIASRTIGDPEQFWRICDASSAMNPFGLLEMGRVLRVPVPQF
jgi:hypothetical protein